MLDVDVAEEQKRLVSQRTMKTEPLMSKARIAATKKLPTTCLAMTNTLSLQLKSRQDDEPRLLKETVRKTCLLQARSL